MKEGMKLTNPMPHIPMPATEPKVERVIKLQDERCHRVLDPKVRTIGVDRQRLDEQIEEKRRLASLEEEADGWHQRVAVQHDKHMQALERESAALRLQRECDVVEYRRRFQKKEQRSEWELNDPNSLKTSIPLRVGQDDPRCTASGLQRFDGEDPDAAERARAQKQQVAGWVRGQLNERQALQAAEAAAERAFDLRAGEQTERAWEVARLQQLQRREATLTTAEFNRRLAEQKRKEAAQAKESDSAKNLEEIQNMLDSDMLNERGTAGHRDRMKGLVPAETTAIRNEQARQHELLRHRRIEEAESRAIDGARMAQEREMGMMLEQQMREEKRAALRKLNEDRREQGKMKAARGTKLYHGNANEIGEQFFERFQRSCR